MKRNTPARAAAAIAWVVAAAAGCANLDLPHPKFPPLDLRLPKLSAPKLSEPASDDFATRRRARNQETLRRLRTNRDFAEYQAALFCHQQGDEKACEDGLRKLLARNPDHREARLLLADLLADREDSSEAQEHLRHLLELTPDDSETQHAMALLLDAEGRDAEALEYYQRAASLEPDSEVYQASCRTALAASQPNDEQPADAGLHAEEPTPAASLPHAEDAALRKSRPFSPARSTVARRLADIPSIRPDTSAATAPAAPLPDSIMVEPKSTEAGKADRSEVSGSSEKAGSSAGVEPVSYERPAGHSGFSEAGGRLGIMAPSEANTASSAELLSRGKEAIMQGNTTTAIAYFRKAVAANPADPQIPTTAAVAALRHGQPETAVELLGEAVKAHPGSASLQQTLAVAHYRCGDYVSSQVAAEQALSLDKSSALSYFLVGSALARLGKAEAAEVHFGQARRLDPRFDAAG